MKTTRLRRGSSTTEAILCIALIAILALAAVRLLGVTLDRILLGSRSTLTTSFDQATGGGGRQGDRVLVRPAR